MAAFVMCAGFGLGLSGPDAAAFQSFTKGVARWQVDPDFRAVNSDYSILGSEAMRTRPGMISAQRWIMLIRSLPGMPKEFAANPTSQLHYECFVRGPLSAYLRLAAEQNVPDYLPLLEGLGRKSDLAETDLRGFLDAFKMDFEVTKDAGAVRSVASLVHDSDAARPFVVRTNIENLLTPHIAALARELHFPSDPEQMTPDQQQAVFERLDGYIHNHDPELWRTKQLSDFCGGIWAQVFGPPYIELVGPALMLNSLSKFGLALLLVGTIIRGGRSPGTGAKATSVPGKTSTVDTGATYWRDSLNPARPAVTTPVAGAVEPRDMAPA